MRGRESIVVSGETLSERENSAERAPSESTYAHCLHFLQLKLCSQNLSLSLSLSLPLSLSPFPSYYLTKSRASRDLVTEDRAKRGTREPGSERFVGNIFSFDQKCEGFQFSCKSFSSLSLSLSLFRSRVFNPRPTRNEGCGFASRDPNGVIPPTLFPYLEISRIYPLFCL